jgi:hypothetical protein
MIVAVAVVALAHSGALWAGWLRRRAAHYAFVAGAYKLEATNHTVMIGFYRYAAEELRRPGVLLPQGYQDYKLFSNKYGGRLTTMRQDDWDPHASRPRDPDPAREKARLLAQAERDRARPAFFAARRPSGREAEEGRPQAVDVAGRPQILEAACSGLMYAGVPTAEPGRVTAGPPDDNGNSGPSSAGSAPARPVGLANPQSTTSVSP